ncbi:Protein of unknown function [Tepidibacter formicigenes DSM 15518]|jgi:hypothetical protein|uniref:Uncharacterized protein n=1 Tax=Tepidibacter formicigenes DSM 15518 TaxID=1123349 RepID=A0A1M6TVH8_9FIRM|nr:Protein of unknown function [Tepidibacter formicigenes DSM 15518]
MDKKINNCFCFNNTNDNFIKWIVELLGPVIFGAKPAEILSFPDRGEDGIYKLKEIRGIIEKTDKTLYREFSYCNKCRKILFYNPIALDNTLREHRNLKFLKNIGTLVIII